MINQFSRDGDGRRRVRITREAGQSLVLSPLCESGHGEGLQTIEVRVSQICPGGTTILEVLVPENIFVERKETVEGVRALFTPA
jgi:hypothetical protein